MGYKNSEGYHDPTAYAAMKDGEKEKLGKLIKTLYSIADLARVPYPRAYNPC
jgi:hypothetical protein